MIEMYFGTDFEKFWSRCGDHLTHPDDEPFFKHDRELEAKLQLASEYKTDKYGPWPFDGPLDKAKVVVCYANPFYAENDFIHTDLINRQRTGVEPLPEPWYPYYQPRIGMAIGKQIKDLSEIVSVVNVCPYPSFQMTDRLIRFAAGLPSVWAAQKYLREVLIPKAQSDEIFLVIARKHQLWGVVEGFNNSNVNIKRGSRGGHLGPLLGGEIRRWLKNKGHIE
jgi:hypothetical protein